MRKSLVINYLVGFSALEKILLCYVQFREFCWSKEEFIYFFGIFFE